jgi:hypothetical protein
LLQIPSIDISAGIRLVYNYFLFSGNLGNEAIMVTKSDEVFVVGSNSAGCLGLGNLQSTLFPKKVEALCNKQVKGMKHNHGFMVTYAV